MKYQLPPEAKIRKQKEFDVVFHKGKFFRSPSMNMWVASSRGSKAAAKIGIIVSRKFSLRANVRNRMKRRIREAFRLLRPQLKLGIEILVQAKRKDPMPPYREVAGELEKLLKQARCLKP